MNRFTSFRVDSTNLRYLDGIVGTCRKRGIKLLFSVSPTLKVVSNDEFLTWLHRYCKGKGVMLIDFSHDRQFIAYPDLFYDATHLNSKGADLFTKCIVSRLKPIIRERRSVY